MVHLPGRSLCSHILGSSRKRQWNISALQAFGFLSKNLWLSNEFLLSLLIKVLFIRWIRRRGQHPGGLMRPERFFIIARIQCPGRWFRSPLPLLRARTQLVRTVAGLPSPPVVADPSYWLCFFFRKFWLAPLWSKPPSHYISTWEQLVFSSSVSL